MIFAGSEIHPHCEECCFTQVTFQPEAGEGAHGFILVLPCNSDETVHAEIGLAPDHGLDHEGILRAWVSDLWSRHPVHGGQPVPDYTIPAHGAHG